MYLAITIPAAIFNCFFLYLALKSIYQYFEYSEYKPRLIIIAIFMLGRFPFSIAIVLTCLINTDILANSIICYFSAMINLISTTTTISLLMLTIYTILIFFSKLSKRVINRIGYIMVFIIFGFLGIIQFIVLPWFGATSVLPFKIGRNNFNRCCSINNVKVRAVMFSSLAFVSFLIFLTSLILLVYFLYTKNLKKKKRNYKFFLVFSLFSAIEIMYPFKLFFEKILGIPLNKTFKDIMTSFLQFSSGLYALIYYMIEIYFRKDLDNLKVELILKIDRTRNIFKEFLEVKGYRSLWGILLQWEKIYPEEDKGQYYSILDHYPFLKESALRFIEKQLEKVVGELAWYDKFCDYYENLEKLGRGEIDLMMQGKISGKG